MTKIYCARWVLPITAGPIRDGAVAVEGTRVAGVGPSFPAASLAECGLCGLPADPSSSARDRHYLIAE